MLEELRKLTVQDINETHEHLKKLACSERDSSPKILEMSRVHLYGWILHREYLNQMEYLSEAASAIIEGIEQLMDEVAKADVIVPRN